MNQENAVSRRLFLNGLATGLLGRTALAALPGMPHHRPTAKRVIVLFQSGGPSQLESFDPKPGIAKLYKQDLPESIRKGQRLTTMSASQSSFPMVPSKFSFKQHGQSGAWVSELFPHTAKIVDDLCFIKSMNTEQINHDPAVTFFQTGFQIAGRPSIGSWLTYGLGSDNQDLPGFVVMISPGQGTGGQPLYDRLWGAGFLPSKYQGVKFRSVGDPVLYLKDPEGFKRTDRRAWLDSLSSLNQLKVEQSGDPETAARIAQYEMAFRMQASVPELTDLSREPESTFQLYGEDARKPGTFAANCLLARRLSERGVRFIQLFHRGLGPPRRPAQGHAGAREGHRSGLSRACHRPEAARPARRHAGDVGRRIRPHRLLPGPAHRHRLRPRPPPAVLHDLAGRRWRPSGHGTRRDGRFLATTSPRIRFPFTTCTRRFCTRWASTTSG